MYLATTIAAVFTAACSSSAYIRYASTVNPDQHIPPAFLRLAHVPFWVDLLCSSAWWASAMLLAYTLPLGLGLAVYFVAAVLPWEIMRRRHNRRVLSPGPSISDSVAPTRLRQLWIRG
ncbi:hypothetical protein ACFYNM_11750 [Streptomyces spororaveus]|uniref:hypothetical protein n=1 Tax=Streptomyces spororaveus TaxID=284039 RepID=UPI0036B2D398